MKSAHGIYSFVVVEQPRMLEMSWAIERQSQWLPYHVQSGFSECNKFLYYVLKWVSLTTRFGGSNRADAFNTTE